MAVDIYVTMSFLDSYVHAYIHACIHDIRTYVCLYACMRTCMYMQTHLLYLPAKVPPISNNHHVQAQRGVAHGLIRDGERPQNS